MPASVDKWRKKERAKLECIGCGVTFEKLESAIDRAGGGKFCTRECRDAHWKGEVTPNWQDGSGVYKRGSNWQSIRRGILKRDDYTCQQCGSHESLHVHHKTPFRMFDDDKVANDESNLVTLCATCHRKEDALRKWIKIGNVVVSMSPETWALTKRTNGTTMRRAA